MFLKDLVSQHTTNTIGLDIGSDFLKLLKVNTTTTPGKIEFFSMSPVPSASIVKGKINDTNAIANSLKNMAKQVGITSANIALAIPRSATIIKNVTIDSRLTPDEIESRAWIEATHHFPELVGDIYLDFTLLGPPHADTSQIELLLVACRKEQIDPYIEICKLAGLKLKIVDVNSFALERALLSTPTAADLNTIALLNLDFDLSTFIVVHEKNLIYAHDQSFDGHRLLHQVAEFTQKQAPEETDSIYLNLLTELLSAHLRHAMHFFYTSRPNVTIEQITLSGDCATIPFLTTLVQQESGIKTILANPFKDIQFGDINVQELKQHEPSLMLCYGLALSRGE